jgi:hypothetical protein
MNKIPSSTNRNADRMTLAHAALRAKGTEALTDHIMDTPDLLVLFCTRAMGEAFYVNWSDSSEEECAKAAAWIDYCEGVFFEAVFTTEVAS